MDIPGTVRDMMHGKSGEVWVASPGDTVYEAVRLMGERNVGALVVVDGGKVVGVISERDYSRKVVLQGRTSRDTLVGDILSSPVDTVTMDTPVNVCMEKMTARRVRHLPVMDGEKLAGIISIGDVVNWVMHTQRQTIAQLHGYIAGGYPG